MNADPLQRFAAGDPLGSLRADTLNALVDAAKQVRRERSRGQAGGNVTGYAGDPPYLEILIRNDTGAALDQWGIVRPADVLEDMTAYPLDVSARPLFQGVTPTADGLFAVTLEPIPEDQIGRAVILGVTIANLNVVDAGHTYASCTTATDKLTTGASGTARIISKESGTGDKLGLVLLQDFGGNDLNTQNVDGTAQDTTTADIRANQASYIKFTTTGGYQRLDIDTAGLCADTTFADCVQSNMTFDVEVDVPSCVSVVLTKTTAVVSGTTVLTDVSAAVFWKVRKVTLPSNTIVGDEGYCITAGECCPTGATAVTVACCPDPIPINLTLTISGGAGDFPMTWSATNSRWETGSITVSGCGTINVTLRCTGSSASGLTIASDVGSNCNLSFSNVTRSCDPFQVQADGLFQSPGFPTCSCVGTTRVFTITP